MSNIFMLLIAASVFIFTAVPSIAEHDDHNHDGNVKVNKPVDIDNINVENGDVVIVVQGIVCSFCSQGVRRKLSKLPYIDSSRHTKGILVDIENQKVTIAIKAGSDLNMQEVFKSIKSGGYEPVVAFDNTTGEVFAVYPEG